MCEASKKRMPAHFVALQRIRFKGYMHKTGFTLEKKEPRVPLSALQQITKTMNLSIFLHQLPISSPLKEACVQVYQTLR